MSSFNTSDFKIAWAKIVARASVDETFLSRLSSDAISVFSEYGFTEASQHQLQEYINKHLQNAIDSIALQKEQQQSVSNLPSQRFYQEYTEKGARPVPEYNRTMQQPDMYTYGSQGACAYGSQGTYNVGTSASSYANRAPISGASSTRLSGPISNMSAASYSPIADCWGSAGTFGSAGSFCGCAGSVGTAGSYGCGDVPARDIQPTVPTYQPPTVPTYTMASINTISSCSPDMRGEPSIRDFQSGASSTRLSGYPTSTIANNGPEVSDCVGSFGTVGSIGCVCGTAGSAGSAGTYGCAGDVPVAEARPYTPVYNTPVYNTPMYAPARINSLANQYNSVRVPATMPNRTSIGGTLGSFATFSGSVPQRVTQPVERGYYSTCWGTMASGYRA